MDKRVTLALEDLKKTNYYMIGLILVSLTLIILLSNNVLSVNSNNKHYKDFVYGYQTGLSFSLLIFPCINLISNFALPLNLVNSNTFLVKWGSFKSFRMTDAASCPWIVLGFRGAKSKTQLAIFPL